MNDLFEMMMQAQNGQAMNNMAQKFGISGEQTEQAISALMPAFSQGLKRNTETMDNLGSFLGALGSGQHGRYYDDPASMEEEDTRMDGDAILGHLFGNKDVSRAVADHAAQTTGIGSAILKQMLPIIASIIMGSLTKQSQNPMLREIIEQMGRKMGGGGMGGGGSRRPSAPSGNNPMGDILGDILGGMFGNKGSGGESSRGGSQHEGSQRGGSMPGMPQLPETGVDMFGQMFEAGRNVQSTQTKAMEDIFSQFLGRGR